MTSPTPTTHDDADDALLAKWQALYLAADNLLVKLSDAGSIDHSDSKALALHYALNDIDGGTYSEQIGSQAETTAAEVPV